MLAVNGLYGHVARNNLKAALLIAGFLLLFQGMQLTIRLIPYAMHVSVVSQFKQFEDRFNTTPAGLPQRTNAGQSGPDRRFEPVPSAIPPKSDPAPAKVEPRPQPTVLDAARLMLTTSDFFDTTWAKLFAIAIVWLFVATWWNGLFIRYATRARPLARRDFPDLYNLVENLAMAAGLPCPAIELVDSDKLNAYACGLTPASARLGLSRGMIERLTRDELEAVVAHELTHIRHGDSRLLAVSKACVDLVLPAAGSLARLPRKHPLIFASIVLMLFVRMPLAMLLPIALMLALIAALTYLFKSLVSNTREFVADVGAIELTKNPQALICALRKIAADDGMPVSGLATKAMLFSGECEGLFATHPSPQKRIEAIIAHARVTQSEVARAMAEPTGLERRLPRALARPVPAAQTTFGRRRGLSPALARAASALPVAPKGDAPAAATFGHTSAALRFPTKPGLAGNPAERLYAEQVAKSAGDCRKDAAERWIVSGRADNIAGWAMFVVTLPLTLPLLITAILIPFALIMLLLGAIVRW